MYVKALRLAGFKSFADPTVLEFEPAVNVIVGPNGSGKSNIADALSWVLGSQAPSSLRGVSMEDVIFAGAAGRPRLGMAEVELTLDNTSRILPLDLAEVTISRYTDRAGESEYRINGAPCRLLDVAELLSDTGIGRSIHTVVGQGQLDAVLQARAEDRRAFIEEAAQVGKYRRRKDRSLKKIERVDDNLTRLEDVLTELRRTLRPLKRQATAAAAYSELLGRHRELKQQLASTELQRLASIEADLDIAGEEHRAGLLQEELAHVQAMLEGASRERSSLLEVAQRRQDVAYRLSRAVDRIAGLARLAEERAARVGARLAAETEEGYRERIRLLHSERDRWGAELGSLNASAERAAAIAAEERATADRAAAAAGEAERRLVEARSRETAAAQDLVRAEGGEAAGRATLGAVEARVQSVLERREVAQRELSSQAAAIARAEQEVAAIEGRLDETTEAAAAAEAALEDLRTNAKLIRDRLNSSHADHAAAGARLRAFEEVLRLFPESDHVRTRLDPLLTDARERAVLAQVGEDEARDLLDEAEAAIEKEWIEVAKQDEELRRLDAMLSGSAERVAGSRRQHEAREIELATLDEELARSRDAQAAAERASADVRAALPAHRAAVAEMKEHREEAERALIAARGEAGDSARRANALQMEARTADERSLAARLRLEEAEAGIADAERALEGLEELRSSLELSRNRARQVAEGARHAAREGERWVLDAEAQVVSAREQARAGEERLASLRTRERELTTQLDEVSTRRHSAEVRRAETRARAQAVSDRAMEEWGLSSEELMDREALRQEEEETARTELTGIEREMRRIGAVNPRAAEEYAELAERETFLVEQIDDLKSSRRDLMKVIREIDDTIVEVFGQAFEDVAREFAVVFSRLFPGGTGTLKLADPSDVLNSGVEVEARPPGKNIRKLSLLSGGERSLTALAFLFAIFRSRPSPFYLLDEVEAALDDVNLLRFLGLIKELEERAQVLIVTHQKRTMEAADVLYGVTMGKDGVSNVVAKRMDEAREAFV